MTGMIALPPAASQIPGKHLCFLVTKATDRHHLNPESLVLALIRLRDFLVERGVTSFSLLVYDPNKRKLQSERVICPCTCDFLGNSYRGLLT